MRRQFQLAVVLTIAAPTLAAAASPAPAKPQQTAAQFEAGLMKRTGVVELKAAKTTLMLGDGYYFLDAADSRKVLVDAWSNPAKSADGVLGMIFAKGGGPTNEKSWGAVLTYEDTGYVSDKDARKLNSADLLKQLNEHEGEQNDARRKAGFQPVHIVGWAAAPAYDAAHHSMVWARDLRFGDQDHDTVNYDVRVLGRSGVLSMNIVAPLSELSSVKPAGEALQQVAVFDQGARYADYNPNTDRQAKFGLAGMILAGAGIVAAKKIGLLAVAALFFKKAAVLVIAVFTGGVAWIKKKLGLKKAD